MEWWKLFSSKNEISDGRLDGRGERRGGAHGWAEKLVVLILLESGESRQKVEDVDRSRFVWS